MLSKKLNDQAIENTDRNHKIIIFFLCLVLLIGLVVLVATIKPASEYNKNMCAMYGYEPDCKTVGGDNARR